MFQPQVIELVYVGNKKFKTDNVCNTGTVWIGYGDAQKVERKHAPKFLVHPDVWLTVEEFEKLHPSTSSVDSSAQFQHALQQLAAQNASTGSSGSTDSQSHGVLSMVGAGLANAEKLVPSAEPDKDDENSTSGKKGDELLAIKNAILSLEQGNPAHFSSTNGVPIASAVRNAASNEDIAAADVRAAWAELNQKG